MGPYNQSKTSIDVDQFTFHFSYNKQLINLERSAFTGKYETSAMPLGGQCGKVSVWDFSIKTSLSVNKQLIFKK